MDQDLCFLEWCVLYDQVILNKRKSVLLVAMFVAFIVVLGVAFNYAIGFGPVGIVLAVVVAGVWRSGRTGSPTPLPWP